MYNAPTSLESLGNFWNAMHCWAPMMAFCVILSWSYSKSARWCHQIRRELVTTKSAVDYM